MAKKKSKKASQQPTTYAGKKVTPEEKMPRSADSGLYFWMYVIGGILMAVGVLTMYLQHRIPGLVILVIGAVLLFYGNKHRDPGNKQS